MKNYFLFTLLLVLFLCSAEAQILRFKVLQSDNYKGLEHVQIKSSSNRTFYTDGSGYFIIQYKDHDTLTLTKEHYHTIHYLIEAKNFDTTHTISLTMTRLPSEGSVSTGTDINTVQKFEYHFVHDKEPENNYLKVHVMDHAPKANDENAGKQQEFKIGHVELHDGSSTKKTNAGANGDYDLK